MIRKLFVFSLVLSVFILFNSCQKESRNKFDETLLYGKWVDGTEYFKYNPDKTGSYWDIDDDVDEDEAQPFTWSLNGSKLRLSHHYFGGGISFENFTVTQLTSSTLRAIDDYDINRLFRKVP